MHILLIQGAGVGGSDPLLADMRPHLRPDETLDAPVMPDADAPAAARWLPAIGEALAAQDHAFVAVGHSLGGSSLLQWLAENPPPANLLAVIGVAVPFWGEASWDASEFALPAGAGEVLARVPQILLLRGDSDDTVPLGDADRYQHEIGHILVETIAGMDHGWSTGGALLLERVRRFG